MCVCACPRIHVALEKGHVVSVRLSKGSRISLQNVSAHYLAPVHMQLTCVPYYFCAVLSRTGLHVHVDLPKFIHPSEQSKLPTLTWGLCQLFSPSLGPLLSEFLLLSALYQSCDYYFIIIQLWYNNYFLIFLLYIFALFP